MYNIRVKQKRRDLKVNRQGSGKLVERPERQVTKERPNKAEGQKSKLSVKYVLKIRTSDKTDSKDAWDIIREILSRVRKAIEFKKVVHTPEDTTILEFKDGAELKKTLSMINRESRLKVEIPKSVNPTFMLMNVANRWDDQIITEITRQNRELLAGTSNPEREMKVVRRRRGFSANTSTWVISTSKTYIRYL